MKHFDLLFAVVDALVQQHRLCTNFLIPGRRLTSPPVRRNVSATRRGRGASCRSVLLLRDRRQQSDRSFRGDRLALFRCRRGGEPLRHLLANFFRRNRPSGVSIADSLVDGGKSLLVLFAEKQLRGLEIEFFHFCHETMLAVDAGWCKRFSLEIASAAPGPRRTDWRKPGNDLPPRSI